MPRGGWALEGIRGFEAALEKAGDEVRHRVANACERTAVEVAQRARSAVPVDKGDLKRAIAHQGRGLNWRVGILAGEITGRGGSNAAHRNPSIYGVWYEYGFRTKRISTTPFMRPARDKEETPHRSRLEAAINGALSSAASASSRHL